MSREILQHQEDLDHLFLQSNQGVPSPPYCHASQEILEAQGGPQDNDCRHRVLRLLFLLLSLFLLEDPCCPLFHVVLGAQHDNKPRLILGGLAALVLQEGRAILASLVSREQNQVSQECQLPLEGLEDQETPVVQGVPSCLHRLPQVCLVDLGGQVVQRPPSHQSGQGTQGPQEDL